MASGKKRKPPAGKRFKKGQSGNPAGRPKIYDTLVTQAVVKKLGKPLGEEFTPDELEKMGLVSEADKRTLADAVAHQLVLDAFTADDINARYRFRTYLIDRAEGKPKQQIDVTGAGMDLAHRTNEELEYFLEHREWPESKTPGQAQSE